MNPDVERIVDAQGERDTDADDEMVRQHLLRGAAGVLRDLPAPRYDLLRVVDVTPRAIQWLWPTRIPLGKITVLDGDPGLGKSLLALDLAARVSRGAPMPDGTTGHLGGPRGVVILSAEDDPSDTIRPRLEAAGADLARIGLLIGVREGDAHPRPPHLGDIETLRRAIGDVGAALVIIDPLMAYISGGTDTHRDHDIRRVLAPLTALSAETGAAFLIIRHLNKAPGGSPLYRGGGSIGIIGAARSGLLAAPDPDDQDGQTRVLAPTKSNLAPPGASMRYQVAEATPGVPVIRWLGASAQTAETLLAATAEPFRARTERDEAAEWLWDLLAEGAVPSEDIQRQARAAGHAWATVLRAKGALHIQATKLGYQGRWAWALPPKDAHSREASAFEKSHPEEAPKSAKNTKDAHALKDAHPHWAQTGEHLWGGAGDDSWLEL